MEDIDIYADLPDFTISVQDDKSENHSEKKEENQDFEIELNKLKEKLDKTESLRCQLEVNFSSLLKTARAELSRKDRTITDLRTRLDNLTFRRGNHKKNIQNFVQAPSQLLLNAEINENIYQKNLVLQPYNYPPPLGVDLSYLNGNNYHNQYSYPPPPLGVDLNYLNCNGYQNQQSVIDQENIYPATNNEAADDVWKNKETGVKDTAKVESAPKDISKKKLQDFKTYFGDSDDSESDDGIVKKIEYRKTIYGERLRQKLLQEKENEEKKKKQDLVMKEENKKIIDQELAQIEAQKLKIEEELKLLDKQEDGEKQDNDEPMESTAKHDGNDFLNNNNGKENLYLNDKSDQETENRYNSNILIENQFSNDHQTDSTISRADYSQSVENTCWNKYNNSLRYTEHPQYRYNSIYAGNAAQEYENKYNHFSLITRKGFNNYRNEVSNMYNTYDRQKRQESSGNTNNRRSRHDKYISEQNHQRNNSRPRDRSKSNNRNNNTYDSNYEERKNTKYRSNSKGRAKSKARSSSKDRNKSKQRNNSINRDKSKPRSSSKDRSKSKPRNNSKNRDKSKPRSSSKDRSKSKPRNNSKNRDKSKPRSNSKDRSKSKPRSNSKNRDKSKPRSNSKNRDKSKCRSNSIDRAKSKSRSNSKNRDKSKCRSNSKERAKSKARSNSKDRDKSKARSNSKDRDKSKARSNSKDRDKSKHRNRSTYRKSSKDRSASNDSKDRNESSKQNQIDPIKIKNDVFHSNRLLTPKKDKHSRNHRNRPKSEKKKKHKNKVVTPKLKKHRSSKKLTPNKIKQRKTEMESYIFTDDPCYISETIVSSDNVLQNDKIVEKSEAQAKYGTDKQIKSVDHARRVLDLDEKFIAKKDIINAVNISENIEEHNTLLSDLEEGEIIDSPASTKQNQFKIDKTDIAIENGTENSLVLENKRTNNKLSNSKMRKDKELINNTLKDIGDNNNESAENKINKANKIQVSGVLDNTSAIKFDFEQNTTNQNEKLSAASCHVLEENKSEFVFNNTNIDTNVLDKIKPMEIQSNEDKINSMHLELKTSLTNTDEDTHITLHSNENNTYSIEKIDHLQLNEEFEIKDQMEYNNKFDLYEDNVDSNNTLQLTESKEKLTLKFIIPCSNSINIECMDYSQRFAHAKLEISDYSKQLSQKDMENLTLRENCRAALLKNTKEISDLQVNEYIKEDKNVLSAQENDNLKSQDIYHVLENSYETDKNVKNNLENSTNENESDSFVNGRNIQNSLNSVEEVDNKNSQIQIIRVKKREDQKSGKLSLKRKRSSDTEDMKYQNNSIDSQEKIIKKQKVLKEEEKETSTTKTVKENAPDTLLEINSNATIQIEEILKEDLDLTVSDMDTDIFENCTQEIENNNMKDPEYKEIVNQSNNKHSPNNKLKNTCTSPEKQNMNENLKKVESKMKEIIKKPSEDGSVLRKWLLSSVVEKKIDEQVQVNSIVEEVTNINNKNDVYNNQASEDNTSRKNKVILENKSLSNEVKVDKKSSKKKEKKKEKSKMKEKLKTENSDFENIAINKVVQDNLLLTTTSTVPVKEPLKASVKQKVQKKPKVENIVNKKPIDMSKYAHIKTVIVIKRRRRPMQLADSPPVRIVNEAIPEKFQ